MAYYRKNTYCNKLLAALKPYKTDTDVSLLYIHLTLTGPLNFRFCLPTACYSATNFMLAH